MTMLTLTTGSVLVMWLGEQITERGIGNGMSLLIYAGIVVGLPTRRAADAARSSQTGEMGLFRLVLLLIADGGGRRRASCSSSAGIGG